MQYPAIFVVSIFIVTFELVKPYSDRASNYAEMFLGVNVLLLLLLRNTEQLKEELKHIPHSVGVAATGECVEDVRFAGASTFAWLLFVLYYLPLLATSFGIALWIIYKLGYVQ